MGVAVPRKGNGRNNKSDPQSIGIRVKPPSYVYAIVAGKSTESVPKAIRGVVVVKEAEGG
jgi:hypothetical protein